MALTQDEKQILAELPATPYGVVLKKLLEEEVAELDSVTNAISWDDTLGRKKALVIIDKIFNFMNFKKPSAGTRPSYE